MMREELQSNRCSRNQAKSLNPVCTAKIGVSFLIFFLLFSFYCFDGVKAIDWIYLISLIPFSFKWVCFSPFVIMHLSFSEAHSGVIKLTVHYLHGSIIVRTVFLSAATKFQVCCLCTHWSFRSICHAGTTLVNKRLIIYAHFEMMATSKSKFPPLFSTVYITLFISK